MSFPRGIVVAAAASHSGKTTVSLGLIAALRARGLKVAAAKCGPDYIDGKFLEAASRRPAVNLDPWAMGPEILCERLTRQAAGADFVVVEGVMGLYDGGPGGAGSTAALARLIGLPVILLVGAQGLAQTAAAVAEGCARLAEGFRVLGAIVNQVASDRHADLIREGFARTSVPLLGLVRRDPAIALPSRHLGLVQAEEHADLARKIGRAAELIEQGCELDVIGSLAQPIVLPQFGFGVRDGPPSLTLPRKGGGDAPSLPPCGGGSGWGESQRADASLKTRLRPLGQHVAVARDVAFAFAYPHLFDDWREQGAEITFFSPLADEGPAPDSDAVFLPGGYPELHAGRIAAAKHFRAGMQATAQRGALIYGECGGYMVLGDELVDAEGIHHQMLALLPLATSFEKRRLHLGYRRLKPLGDLPWAEPLTAHEFHFASILTEGEGDRLFEAESADGSRLGPIGLRRGRVMGSFAHVIDRGA